MTYFIFAAVILTLIISAGFIAGVETAITGASRAYLYHLAKKGDKKAQKALMLKENMTTVIGTILVVNQLIIYFIPIISTLFAIKYLSTGETAIMQTVIGVLLVIYAEIFPKMLAIQFASKYALSVAPFIDVVVSIFKPIITILEWCAKNTLVLCGVKMNEVPNSEQADDELRGAIEMHSSDGDEEEAQKKNMLKSILDLGEIPVSHTMVHRKHLKTIDGSLPIEQIGIELMSCPFSRVPIWKDNPENIIGIIRTKTFFRAWKAHQGELDKIKLSELMSTPWYIPETTCLLDQLQNFKKKREHFALVVDEYGDLMGCITLEDILEEIVGEIVDEYDVIVSGMKLQADGSVIADGATPIRDLNREFDWSIPEEEAATIGGYLMHELRKIPDAGQVYSIQNFKFEILRRQRNQISLVRVIPLPISTSPQ